tara:strand:- start:86 stop:385 length:300 start_codon:yes stop_codon:yes gene_type:complete
MNIYIGWLNTFNINIPKNQIILMNDLKEIILYFTSRKKFYLLPITLSILMIQLLLKSKRLLMVVLFAFAIGFFIARKESSNNKELSLNRYPIYCEEVLI